jgi:hypothetical protein
MFWCLCGGIRVRLFGDLLDKDIFLGDRKMRTKIIFLIIALASLVSISFAQLASPTSGGQTPAVPEGPVSTEDVNAVNVPSFPYTAEITGDNVYIRSGPGTNYYDCGRINKGDKVEVVNIQFSWSRIVPPAGSFSWISMQYVSIDPNDPTIGIVSGDDVRVYAGSEAVKPLYSTTLQLKLNNGDKVKLLGEEKDNYYKIVPPTGAYFWVSTQYTKPIEPVGKIVGPAEPPVEPNVTAAVVATNLSVEAEKLKEYYALEKQIQAEQAKPIDQQNYADIKKALDEIANNKEAGKAARYCEFSAKMIERFDLALAVAKEVQLQNEQLQQTKERIEKARTTRLSEHQDLGKYVAIGQFQTFETYGPGHYRVIDDSGKTICYALPSDSASQIDLSKFVGKKVGLVGTREPHLETQGTLVRFTEIAELK